MYTEQILQVKLGLAPMTSRILNKLLHSLVVSSEEISELSGNYRLAIGRLRDSLQPFGVTVQSRRMLGYWLSDDDKQKLHDIILRPTSLRPTTTPTPTPEHAAK